MSKRTKLKTVSVASFTGASMLLVAGSIAPSAGAAETNDGNVKVSNTETVQVYMDAAGEIKSQRVYEQLVLSGKGNVDLSNPVSSDGLRNLDGFGGFEVQDGAQRVKTDVSGTEKYRTVSNFNKKLPLDVKVKYFLDGKEVQPGDVVGESGVLDVQYTVTNMTGVDQDVKFPDGSGAEQSQSQSVVVPMVGSLTTTLPSNFTKVTSAEANAAGDGRGGTQLSFTMTLFPPIGAPVAKFGYQAQVEDGVVPKASVSALPLNPMESPSFKGGADSYKGGAQTGQDLTAGVTEIDKNLLKLADGATELVDGLLQLRDGADELNTGAGTLSAGTGELDAGAGKLKDGTGKLSAGAGDLDDGANKLSAGTGKFGGGADDLNDGAAKIADGLKKLNAGVKGDGSEENPGLISGLEQLDAGLITLDGKLEELKQRTVPLIDGKLIPGVEASITDIQKQGDDNDPRTWGALRVLDTVGAIASGVQGTLTEGDQRIAQLEQAKGLASGLRTKLNSNIGTGDPANPAAGTGLNGLRVGLGAISGGIAGGVGLPGDPADSNGKATSLRSGVTQLRGGLGLITDGANDAVDGVGELSAGAKSLNKGTESLVSGVMELNGGAGQLAAGTGTLSSGAGELNTGAGDLAEGTGKLNDGAGKLADGSGKLSGGLVTAADGAPALPDGANQLSEDGTSKLILAGNATASKFGLSYALIEAGAERAADSQPYGSPEGADALTAYKFELAGNEGETTANTQRGLAALGLFVGAGALAGMRRRGII